METRPIISKGKNRLAYLFCYIRKFIAANLRQIFDVTWYRDKSAAQI